MRWLKFVVLWMFSFLLLFDVAAFAAQPKKAKVAPAPLPIYEAPMRVVVVRNSFPTCEPDCPQWISAEGEITAATPAAFRRVFKQVGAKNLPLVIRSPGGSINAAIEIGNMVRKRKMTVAVGFTLYRGCRPDEKDCKLPKEAKGVYTGSIAEYNAFCNSACPMILAAGTTRLASSVAWVGLHQPKTEWSREWVRWRDTYKIINGKKKILKRTIISRKVVKGKTTYGLDKGLRKKMGNYYKAMGIDLAILDEMMRAKYEDMYWLPDAGRDKLHLRTSVGSAGALGNVTKVMPAVGGIESCTIKGAQYVGEICKTQKATLAVVVVKPTGAIVRQKPLLDPSGLTLRIYEAKLADRLCGNKCPHWIAVEGIITERTPLEFAAMAGRLGKGQVTVIFNSNGGDALAAMELGRIIRKLNFATAVGKTWPAAGSAGKREAANAELDPDAICHDACILAYAGGSRRYVDSLPGFLMQNPADLTPAPGNSALFHVVDAYLRTMSIGSFVMNEASRSTGGAAKRFSAQEAMVSRLATDEMPVNMYLRWNSCEMVADLAGCDGR
jgi:hypothetical protein